jgi:SAM-dependent methyltransferase
VVGSAGRGALAPEEAHRAARTYWEAEADAYQAEHGAFLADPRSLVVDSVDPTDRIDYQPMGSGFVWGPEGVTEAELGMLGPLDALAGRRVLEVGCGAAQCSAWLGQRGVHAVGIDIAVNQLRHGAPPVPGHALASATGHVAVPASAQPGGWLPQEQHQATRFGQGAAGKGAGAARDVAARDEPGVGVPAAADAEPRGTPHLVAAAATRLPFVDDAFDAAFAAYGAIQFVADLPQLLSEVRRALRPAGRWVFSVTHPIRWAFPDDPGPAGLSVSGSYFDRTPYVERDESGAATYAEFHRTIGDYVSALTAAGFLIESMVEPEWPDWNEQTWGGWSPLRGTHLPGTLIIGCRADVGAG